MKHKKMYERQAEIEAMAAGGLSLSEMARRLATNKRHVKAFLEEAGISHDRFRQVGPNNPAWRGGRMVDKDGYVLLYRPDHPNATRHGYVREHRLVMEEALGRYLSPTEVVHHRESPKTDNRLENLRLYDSNGDHLADTLVGKPHQISPEGHQKLSEQAQWHNANRQPLSAEARRKMGWQRGTARKRRPYTMTPEEKERRRELMLRLRERQRTASLQE